MNIFVAMGNLGKSPEVRYTNDGKAVATFTIAVKRRFQPDTDWFDCVTFGKTAEFCEKYLNKGSKVVIQGQVQNNNYTDKNGQKRYGTKIVVESIEFAESKKAKDDTADGFINVNDLEVEEELPFA